MARGLLIFALVVVALVTSIWLAVIIKGWRVHAARQARDLAAVRIPPKPPQCGQVPPVAGLEAADLALAKVRIFRFIDTLYFIPDAWLDLEGPKRFEEAFGTAKTQLGLYDPDLHRDECRGIVHQITDGGLYINRHVGIRVDRAALSSVLNVSSVYFHKLRPEREAKYTSSAGSQSGGLVDGKMHIRLDACVRLSADVAVRLEWHPANYTADRWSELYRQETRNQTSRPRLSWPWDEVPDSPEFRHLTAAAHALHRWLTTPPNARPDQPPGE